MLIRYAVKEICFYQGNSDSFCKNVIHKYTQKNLKIYINTDINKRQMLFIPSSSFHTKLEIQKVAAICNFTFECI